MKLNAKTALAIVLLGGAIFTLYWVSTADVREERARCERMTHGLEVFLAGDKSDAYRRAMCNSPEVRDRTCMPAVRVCEKYGVVWTTGGK